MHRNMFKNLLMLLLLFLATNVIAGGQREEDLSHSVKAMMQKSVSDLAAPKLMFSNKEQGQAWLAEMSRRMEKRMPNKAYREGFLTSVHYEATRAGLDPQLVLSLINVESAFNKYAVSSVGARGYMQVMPFWAKAIGESDHNLFNLRLNLRYGCTILRHYLDIERGNLFRALGRYNGSLGKAKYPNLVIGKWRKYWSYKTTVAKK
jgi:soluble lytic murein transglycosylase-like protein